MKHKSIILFFLFFLLLGLVACSPAGGTEPEVDPGNVTNPDDAEPEVAENSNTNDDSDVDAGSDPAEGSIDDCAEALPGTKQLLYAAQGVCFLYPDHYDVFQGEDGSLTLFVNSLLNTEAPLASLSFESLDGRTDLVSDYLPDIDLATVTLPTVDLGGEIAIVLDALPGQDTNRRILATHGERVINIMIARIGPDYGAVGEQAEALSSTIVESFHFIGMEADAPLLAGPECPESQEGMTLFTNDTDGFCLLLPSDYEAEISEGQTTIYLGSVQDVNHPRLFINVEAANGRTLEEITAAKDAEIAEILGAPALWSFGYMVDGIPANRFDQVPGQDFSRQVMFVQDDKLYTLTFIPDEPAAGDAYTEMQNLYDIVMDSFSFLRQ